MEDLVPRARQFLASAGSAISKIAASVPVARRDMKLHDYLHPILVDGRQRMARLREAFGFPRESEPSRALANLLVSLDGAGLQPISNVFAHRLHIILGRLLATLHQIASPEALASVEKIGPVREILDPHVIARAPTLTDLRGIFGKSHDIIPFAESAIDPMLYAVLRGLSRDKPGSLSKKEQVRVKAAAIDYLYRILRKARRETVDDSSNLWWAARIGLCTYDLRFSRLLSRLVDLTENPIVPKPKVLARSLLPETHTLLRTQSYTLSNIQAIRETSISFSPNIRQRLENRVQALADALLNNKLSGNLYLACAHYEGVMNFLDYVGDRFFDRTFRRPRIRTSSFCPLPDYACTNDTLNAIIVETIETIKRRAPADRMAVLVYGDSSTGKSYLIEKFFERFKQAQRYKAGRIISGDSRKSTLDRLQTLLSSLPPPGSKPILPAPFIFVDEVDTDLDASIFPDLLYFLEKGCLNTNFMDPIPNCVLFLAGGKFGSFKELTKRFRAEGRTAGSRWDKGLDVYNRCAARIELTSGVFNDRNLLVATGLVRLSEKSQGEKIKIDEGVLSELRTATPDGGLRGVKQIVDRFAKRRGTIVVPRVKRGVEHEVVP